jgi:hypothetical protein
MSVFLLCNIGSLLVGLSPFPCICRRCVLVHLLHSFLFCLFLVCWVRGNVFGGPGHIFSVWDSAVWSSGPVQFI